MSGTDRAARQLELAAFLRASRAAVDPTSVGLAPGRRRVAGLRREEVASRASISLSWYLKLERGYDVSMSAEIVDAIAAALQLDTEGHRHLRRLAGHPAPRLDPPAEVDPRLVRLVEHWTPGPAYIINRWCDLVTINRPFIAIYGEPLSVGGVPNALWSYFTSDLVRCRSLDWEQGAAALVGSFRVAADRRPGSERPRELVNALTEVSEDFRRLWAAHRVERFKTFPHRVRIDGDVVRLDSLQLRPVEQPDLVVVLTGPASPSDTGLLRRNLMANVASSGEDSRDSGPLGRPDDEFDGP